MNSKLLTEELLKQIKLINYDRSKPSYEQNINEANDPIKPLWNKNIKEFVHPAYVDYPDVAKQHIYKKNADGTFS